jgi:hypothetical protein
LTIGSTRWPPGRIDLTPIDTRAAVAVSSRAIHRYFLGRLDVRLSARYRREERAPPRSGDGIQPQKGGGAAAVDPARALPQVGATGAAAATPETQKTKARPCPAAPQPLNVDPAAG